MSGADAGAGVAGALGDVDGGDCVGGCAGCWLGRGNGGGPCAMASVGTVKAIAPSKRREELPSMILIKPQKCFWWQYF